MSPSAKRWPTDEEYISDEESQDDQCTESGATTNVGTLDALTDVLLDILDELCQVHELLRRHMGTGSLPSPEAME